MPPSTLNAGEPVVGMLKTADPQEPTARKTDDELMALVEAFQFFNRSTSTLNQAYRRLEGAAEALANELDETNLQLQVKNRELDRVNRYLEDILASIGSGVTAVDLEGRITIFNRTAEDLTGYTRSEIIGQNYQEYLAGEMGNQSPLIQTLLTGKPVEGMERELPLKSGGSITVKSSSSWVVSSAGERIGVVETIEDVSQVRALERRILHQKTLAALGEMAAQVAHEIRNPLAGIKGFAGLLVEDLKEGDRSRAMALRIIEGVDSLDRIASNLLIFTQDCQGEFNRQPLEPIFEQAITLMESGCGGTVRFRRDFPPESCPARVDGEKIKQLLLNLFKNGCEASQVGGVSESEGAATPEVHTGYRFNPLTNEVRLFVRDFGPGVPPEALDKMFNPFFTTRSRGTGLGLAIVKKIAELHRGRVEHSKPEDGGALFTVYLPIV